MEGDHAVQLPMQNEDREGHVADLFQRGEALVEESGLGVGQRAVDEGQEAEGEGAGMVERGGGEVGEGAVEDNACWLVLCRVVVC